MGATPAAQHLKKHLTSKPDESPKQANGNVMQRSILNPKPRQVLGLFLPALRIHVMIAGTSFSVDHSPQRSDVTEFWAVKGIHSCVSGVRMRLCFTHSFNELVNE